jgi:methylenetetrahydrofolate reductase (NADPH)
MSRSAEMGINLINLGKNSFPGLHTPAAFHENHQEVASELVADGSVEYSFGNPERIPERAERLPFGMPVFVPMQPFHTLSSRRDVLARLHAAGLEPVPHLAARQLASRSEAREFLDFAVGEAGVHRVLLVGGDVRQPRGPYMQAAELLADGLLLAAGIKEVGFAGFPEGHPEISAARMFAALTDKLGQAAAAGLGSFVVTQFTMVPARIIEFCTDLAAAMPEVPVFAGLAGPTAPDRLVHFARYCGVSASLSAVRKVGVKVPQVVDHVATDQQLALLASFNANHHPSNIIGVHLFSFGGFGTTVEWVHSHCGARD